jgi:hypothetical protein
MSQEDLEFLRQQLQQKEDAMEDLKRTAKHQIGLAQEKAARAEQMLQEQAVKVAELKQHVQSMNEDVRMEMDSSHPYALHQQRAPGAAVPRMPNIFFENKPEEDWEAFKRSFLNLCFTQKWDDTTAKCCLYYCVRGQAFRTISLMNPQDQDMDLAEMMKTLDKKFLPPSASELARERFDNAVQQPKELVLDWHSRVLLLYQRAYPVEAKHTLNQAMRRFIKGLSVSELRKQVRAREPKDYDEALEIALLWHAILTGENYQPGLHDKARGPQPLDHLSAMEDKTEEGVGARNSIAVLKDQLQCHSCGQFGHFSRECPRARAGGKGVAARAKSVGGVGSSKVSSTTGGPSRDKSGRFRPGFKRRMTINEMKEVIAELESSGLTGEDILEDEEEGQEDEETAERHF